MTDRLSRAPRRRGDGDLERLSSRRLLRGGVTEKLSLLRLGDGDLDLLSSWRLRDAALTEDVFLRLDRFGVGDLELLSDLSRLGEGGVKEYLSLRALRAGGGDRESLKSRRPLLGEVSEREFCPRFRRGVTDLVMDLVNGPINDPIIR